MVAYLRIKQARLEPKEATSSHIIVPSTLDEQHALICDSVTKEMDRTVPGGHVPIVSHPPVAEIRNCRHGKWVGVSSVHCKAPVIAGQGIEVEVRDCFLRMQGKSMRSTE